jgi:hypothetical protein
MEESRWAFQGAESALEALSRHNCQAFSARLPQDSKKQQQLPSPPRIQRTPKLTFYKVRGS